MDFQTLDYIPLSCFLESKLFLAERTLVGTEYDLPQCFSKNQVLTTSITEKFSSFLPCHNQVLIWKFSYPLARANCFRLTRTFSTSSSLSIHLTFTRKVGGCTYVTSKSHSPDRTAFVLQAHAAPSGECNYYVHFMLYTSVLYHTTFEVITMMKETQVIMSNTLINPKTSNKNDKKTSAP